MDNLCPQAGKVDIKPAITGVTCSLEKSNGKKVKQDPETKSYGMPTPSIPGME